MRRRRAGALLTAACMAAASLWPVTASAASTTQPHLTPGDAREIFVNHGFTVGELSAWSDGITAFSVSDSLTPQVRVLVFADAAAAQAYRESRIDFTAADVAGDRGPRLLSGYGGSAWRGNLALVQQTSDPAAFAPEPECVPDPVFTDLAPQPARTAPATSVEARFLDLLSI